MLVPESQAPQPGAAAQLQPRAAFETFIDPFVTAASSLPIRRFTFQMTEHLVEVLFASEELREVFLPAIAHLQRASSARPDVQLMVWDGTNPRIARSILPFRLADVGRRGEVACTTGDGINTAVFVASNAVSMYDEVTRRGAYWVPDAKSVRSYDRAAPFRTILHWICAATGRRLVHGAAVGTDDGALLIAGRGGSGKSTTALLALLAGMRYAGDDYVAITTADSPRVFSLYESAKVTPETLEKMPELNAALLTAPTVDDKGVVLASRVPGAVLAPVMPLRGIAVPRITNQPGTSIRRAKFSEVMLALAPTTMFQLPGNYAPAFEDMAAVIQRLPGWILELGTNLSEIPAVVAEAIVRSAV